MLCCFRPPACELKLTSPLQAQSIQANELTAIANPPESLPEEVKCGSLSDQTAQRQPGPDFDQHDIQEPWRSRLSGRLVELVSSNALLRAAGCWVCSKDHAKCFLVAGAPSTAGNTLRSALHGFFVGSAMDLRNEKSSSVAHAIISKAPVAAVVLANGQVQGDMPSDLRQLYERLCRTVATLRAGPSTAGSPSAWHLSALPILVHNEAVGALVVVGQLDLPETSSDADTSCVAAALEAATAARLKAAAGLADELFSSPALLACARNVAALVASVLTAPDHTAAVRNAAAHVHALLPSVATISENNSTMQSSPSSSSAPSAATAAAAVPAQPMAPGEVVKPLLQPLQQQQLVVTTGLVVSRGATSRAAVASNSLNNNSNTTQSITTTNDNNSVANLAYPGVGSLLHLYLSNTNSSTTLPVSTTLITRAPIRADALAVMLSEALAAPVSSAALAVAAAQASGPASSAAARWASTNGPQQQQQKLLTLRCPEDELPHSQPRADLAALEAAGARAPRGSVAMVSCPLPTIMCAVVVYVCVAPPPPAAVSGHEPADAAATASDGSAAVSRPWAVATGSGGTTVGQQPTAGEGPSSGRVFQLPEAQLKLVLKHLSSAVEIMANALEQRMLSSCAPSPTRPGGKGPYTVDVTADTTGLLAVSVGGTDGEDSNGFWGSASGPMHSGENITTTSQLSANTAIPNASPTCSAGCVSLSRGLGSKALHSVPADVKAAAPAAAAAAIASSLALTNFAAPQVTGTEACIAAMGIEEQCSGYLRPIDPGDGRVDKAVTGGKAATTASASCAMEQHQHHHPGQDAAVGAGASLEAGTRGLPEIAAAGTSLVKLPSIGSTLSAEPAPNDTDSSQDTAFQRAAAAAALRAVAAQRPAGVRGASGSAAASSSIASGSSGVEITISALDFGTLRSGGGSDSRGRPPPPNKRDVADVPAPVTALQLQSNARLLLTSSGSSGTVTFPVPPLNSDPRNTTMPFAAGRASDASSAVAAVAIAQQGGCCNKLLTVAGGQALSAADEGTLPLPAVGSNGRAGGIGSSGGPQSISSDQMARVMVVRNRSKDWSDQSGEPERVDCRLAMLGEGELTAAPRLRPMKVLSLDKAAQQLQRSSGSSPGVAMHQGLQVPPLPQQQQQYQLQGYSLLQPGGAFQGSGRGQSWGGSAAAASTAASVASAAPPPYVPYMPRRLNRMYLQPAALVTSGGSMGVGGVPVSPAGLAARATLVGGPYGSATAISPLSHLSQHIQLTVRPIERAGDAAALGAVASALRPAAATQIDPLTAGPEGTVQGFAANAVSLGRNSPDAAEPASTTPLPATPVTGLSPALHSCTVPPSTVATAAAVATAHTACVPAGAETLAGTSPSSQKSRQLSDFVIPEDRPLEYTVSETVQMMRMLAQARGVHLSARMRRVRVTAKIHSTHPDAVPVDLPSQIAKAALLAPHAAAATSGESGGGLFAATGGRGPSGSANGSWVLTGVVARRGCVELVFDVVQVRGSGGAGLDDLCDFYVRQQQPAAAAARCRPSAAVNSGSSRCASSLQLRGLAQGLGPEQGCSAGGGAYVQASALAQASQPQPQGQSGNCRRSYRRWQGAGVDELADLVGLNEEQADAGASQPERAAAGSSKRPSVATAAAVGEQMWLRNTCGMRPEAVAQVLQSCGLLKPGNDAFVDLQIGHSEAGAGTLVWHEASGLWVMVSAAGVTPAVAAAAAAPVAGSFMEAPTLWLPCCVALLAPGSHVLQDIRVVSTIGTGRSDVVDELTVRSAYGYLPIRVAVGMRMEASGAGSGSSVPALPLLLEDDPVADVLADRTCIWRLMDIGGALPRSGGLLLVECRRTAARDSYHETACTGSTLAAVTSVPVPLVVLPEQYAAAASELERLRVYMARLLLGSEDVLRSANGTQPVVAAAEARAEAAAQVEMACQQFLMDLGVLIDAAAAATATGTAPDMNPGTPAWGAASAPGPSSCPQAVVCGGGAHVGGGRGCVTDMSCAGQSNGGGILGAVARMPPHSFSEAQSASHSKRPQLAELQVSPVCTTDVLSSMPSCSSPLTILGVSTGGRGSEQLGAWTSEACGFAVATTAADNGVCNFAEDMKKLMQARRTVPSAAGADLTTGPSGDGGAGGAGGGADTAAPYFTEFGEHLMDVACTVLGGCCTAGMQCTAMLVLQAACGELSLAAPEVLLAEAGADPRVRLELLSAYTARARQSSRGPLHDTNSQGASRACVAAVPICLAAASGDPGKSVVKLEEGIGAGVAADAALAAAEGALAVRPERHNRGGASGWNSVISDGNDVASSINSRSHSLAVMLDGKASSPLALQERAGDEAAMSSAEFSGWQRDLIHEPGSASAVQQQDLDQKPDSWSQQQRQQRQEGMVSTPGNVPDEDPKIAAAWLEAAGAALAPVETSTPPERKPVAHALAVGSEIPHQDSPSASNCSTTWGSASTAGTPDAGTRTASESRPASNLLGSEDMAVDAIEVEGPPPQAASASGAPFTRGAEGDQGSRALALSPAASMLNPGGVLAVTTMPASVAVMTGIHKVGLGRSPQRVGVPPLCASCPSVSPAVAQASGSGAVRASARSSGTGCSLCLMPIERESRDEEAARDKRISGGAAAARRRSVCGCNGGGAPVAAPVASLRGRSGRSYFLLNLVISLVSCTRAWMEDGLSSCLTLVVFSGLQAVVLGWYCIAYGACNARCMVAAAVGCKAVRLTADVLMGTRLLQVPSLMEPMTRHGIEIWSEALMRPTVERVPFATYCLMTLLELPCVWLMYCHFRDIFPDLWMRSYPFLRTLAFIVLAALVNALAEFYWRREFRHWWGSTAASCGIKGAGTVAGALTGGARQATTTPRWKKE